MDKAFKVAVTLAAYDKITSIINSAVNNATKKFSAFQKAGHNLKEFSERALLAGEQGKEFFMGTIEAAEESEKSINRLHQVFTSMGQAQSVAARGAEEYAATLQLQVGKEDEVVRAVQAKLATFSSVIDKTGEMSNAFNRSTKLAFDLEATGFGDASSNAAQLGKALQDPVKGINSLRRAGISFTDQEKAKIKALVASGKVYKAQEIVLKAIEKQVGGVAEKTATSTAKMGVAWNEVKEQIGRALMPTFEHLTELFLNKIVPAIQSFVDKYPNLVKWLAIGSAAFFVFGTAVSVLSFAIKTVSSAVRTVASAFQFLGKTLLTVGRFMMANPILIVIAVIATAAFLIYEYWEPIKNFFRKLWDGTKNVFATALNGIKTFLTNFTPLGLVFKYWGPISSWFKGLWNKVTAVFRGSVSLVKALLNPFTAAKLLMAAWSGLGGFFANVWARVKGSFASFWGWLKSIPERFFEAGKNMMKSLWNGIKAMAMAPVNAVKNIVKKVRDFLPFSPAKTGPLRDIHRIKLMETIAATIKPQPLVRAMNKATSAVASTSGSLSNVNNRSSGATIHLNYAPVINGGDNNSIVEHLRRHSKDMMQMLNEEMRKSERRKF